MKATFTLTPEDFWHYNFIIVGTKQKFDSPF